MVMSYVMERNLTPPMRAAIYVRISLDMTGEGRGVARQEEDCRALADHLGWDIAGVYIDNDVSAYAKVRPNYRRMLEDITAGRIDAIVAWAPDRIYRRLVDLEELIRLIDNRNVAIRTVKAGEFDLSTGLGKMIARILGSVAQGEGDIKSERWMRSWRQAREHGLPARTGSRMFGYTRDGQLIEAEAAIARRMASDILDGTPILAVARWLETEGIKTTRDTIWRPATVRQYLANPRIAGWSTLNGEIVAEGKWTPVLDRETWEMVHALLGSRARPYVPRKSVLNGLLVCGICESRMITSGQRGKRTYRCPNRPGMDGCGRVSGNADPVEKVVDAYALRRLADPRVRAGLHEAWSKPHIPTTKLAELEQRIEELEAQLDEPGVPVATLLRAIDRAKERQAELVGQAVDQKPVDLPGEHDEWPKDLHQRRALIELVVERVALHPATRPGSTMFEAARVKIRRRRYPSADSSHTIR